MIPTTEIGKMGLRGSLVIPARIRKRLGLNDGDLLILEATDTGLIIRPAVAVPASSCSPERRAEFILNAAIDQSDYQRARAVVTAMGLDPDRIEHDRPKPSGLP